MPQLEITPTENDARNAENQASPKADGGTEVKGPVGLMTGALQNAIFNSANFSYIATDADGIIQIFNVGAERMLGYTAAEVTNKITPADISDPEEMSARAQALTIALGTPIAPGLEAMVFKASREIEDIYELTYIRKDGSRFPAMVSVTALRNLTGTIIGYLLIGTDNTARKQVEEERAALEQALRQKNAALEESNRMKSEFLANMSHELRTPLNAIIGFSEVMRDGLLGDLTDQQRKFIGEIYGSGKHLLSVINDILDLSKVEAGKMTLDLEPVHISGLLTNSLAIVRETAVSRHIEVSMDASEDLGLVQVDGRKVKQIVYNLLSNALKFTADGGKVAVRAGRVPASEVGQPHTSWPGRNFGPAGSDVPEFVKISITDSGIGISPEGLQVLFQPFSQIDSGLARRFEGTGLGLALVKLLAELHGGTLSVESAVGAGSCFTVWLPFRPQAEESAAHSQIPTAVPLTRATTTIRRALVVEDDMRAAELIRVQLEAEGFTVMHASNGKDGLILAVQQPLSLITLDIMLPDMDGWEFLACIRELQSLKRVPVVVISIVADRTKGLALGAAAVLQKPVSRQDLIEALVELGLFPVAPGNLLRVLVVDDDPKAVDLNAFRIAGLSSTVIRAYGGREAIDTARKELPDLILLDLMMPWVSGFDVISALDQDPATALIPIIVVTAKSITAEERTTLEGRVRAIMQKGEFDRARFIAEVRRATSLPKVTS